MSSAVAASAANAPGSRKAIVTPAVAIAALVEDAEELLKRNTADGFEEMDNIMNRMGLNDDDNDDCGGDDDDDDEIDLA